MLISTPIHSHRELKFSGLDKYVYIYIYIWLVLVFNCLYLINAKTAEPIRPIFFVEIEKFC